jgi:hypothetical protein
MSTLQIRKGSLEEAAKVEAKKSRPAVLPDFFIVFIHLMNSTLVSSHTISIATDH